MDKVTDIVNINPLQIQSQVVELYSTQFNMPSILMLHHFAVSTYM